jgi:hypothetical protein
LIDWADSVPGREALLARAERLARELELAPLMGHPRRLGASSLTR